MKGESRSILIVLRNVLCGILAILMVMAVPTGWLYDLRAGTGTEQGQKPGRDVRTLRRKEDVEDFFLAKTPATVAGGDLTACPLARLRDMKEEGNHYLSGPGRRTVYISEYIATNYPIPKWERAIQTLLGGAAYNRYYLAELEDGSWICVYFDDYLTLTGPDAYPTGYLRYTTTEERVMLNQMAEDYDVDPVYVLDMYRHGKVRWMVDLPLRMAAAFAVCIGILCIGDGGKKRKGKDRAASAGGIK